MISAPEDYGLSPQQTLAHRVDRLRPADFEEYWGDFREELASLSNAWHGAIDAPVNRVIIPSARSVRIIGRLTMPEDGEPRGVVITTHGYSAEPHFPDEPEPWTRFGMATLRLRVRGFPPSTLDTPDLRHEWITHRIESRDGWILRGAVADLVQGYRCVRRHFGEVPIMLHGESFGAGLAIIAAAQLEAMNEPPRRLAIGLPTFGDWRWRLGRYCAGSGGLINVLHERLRLGSDDLLATLELFDAAFHARSVRSTVLCKLAQADDAVPAPSAAAVFNALPGDLGVRKWRFIVRYGHFDGGIADARRHVLFERLQPAFLYPAVEPGAALAEVDLEAPAAQPTSTP